MSKINLLKDIQATIYIKCPECENDLSIVGLSDSVLWCKTYKKAYYMELRKSKVLTEEDLKDVVGFK